MVRSKIPLIERGGERSESSHLFLPQNTVQWCYGQASSLYLTSHRSTSLVRRRGCDGNCFPPHNNNRAANHRVSLAFALCGSSGIGSWMGTCARFTRMSPSRSEGKRMRRWRTAGTFVFKSPSADSSGAANDDQLDHDITPSVRVRAEGAMHCGRCRHESGTYDAPQRARARFSKRACSARDAK